MHPIGNPLILSACAAVVLFCVSCKAEEKKNVTCYVCVEGVDDHCADKFKKDTPETDVYSRDCNDDDGAWHPNYGRTDDKDSPFYNVTAKGCRKTLQEIDGTTHVVRQCSYNDKTLDGFKRTGNKGVRLFYYQCVDGPNCNVAARQPAATATFTVMIGVVLSIFMAFAIRS